MGTALSTQGINSGANSLNWIFHFGGTDLAAGGQMQLGNGVETPLYLDDARIGPRNGGGFVSKIGTNATGDRDVDLADAPGVLTPMSILRQTTDVTSSTTSAADVPALQFTPLAGGVYEFELKLEVRSAATTTGVQIDITGPAQVTINRYVIEAPVSALTTMGFTSGGGISLPIQYQPGTAPVANSTFPITIRGKYTVSSTPSGPIGVSLSSEVAASTVTIKAGSTITHKRLA